MTGICVTRLKEERKAWRKDHPIGFYAKQNKKDGVLDMQDWEIGIPGVKETDWEGGVYTLKMIFPDEYPSRPPKCQFVPALFHPNVYPSGTVCLSLLDESKGWKPSITVKQIVLGIQKLLNEPNPEDPAQYPAFDLFKRDRAEYNVKIQEQAKAAKMRMEEKARRQAQT